MNRAHHWGCQPMPCVNCSHQSRDHSRSTKQFDGSWNGACQFVNCTCKLYIRPKSMKQIKTNEFEDKPCEIQCMVFNETAKSIMELIGYDIPKKTHKLITLDRFDPSHLEIDLFNEADRIVKCEDGWSLN